MKLSDLRTAAEIHDQDMLDPEYRREYERAKLASDVAVRVLAYRTQHGMSQTELARRLSMRQPNIARLESGEHEPSLSTLARLSSVLGVDFSVDITPAGACLAAPRSAAPTRGGRRAILAHAGAVSARGASVMTGQAASSNGPAAAATQPAGKEERKAASPGRDQKAARLRDVERLSDLVHPYTRDTSAPISDAIARMPAAGQAEVRGLLDRLGAISEDRAKSTARQQILLDIARAATVLGEVLSRPRYKVSNGRVVTDPSTGLPVADHSTELAARSLLADMESLRSRLIGPPSGDDADNPQ